MNTKPDLFYKRQFAAIATGQKTQPHVLPPPSDTISNTSCFLDTCMSKVLTELVSVGIEATSTAPNLWQRKSACKWQKNFSLFTFFIDLGRDGVRVLLCMHESRTRVIHSGTVVGHHYPRSQLIKVSARLITRWSFVRVQYCPSVEFLMRHSCTLSIWGLRTETENRLLKPTQVVAGTDDVSADKKNCERSSARGIGANRGNKPRGIKTELTFTGIGVYTRQPHA